MECSAVTCLQQRHLAQGFDGVQKPMTTSRAISAASTAALSAPPTGEQHGADSTSPTMSMGECPAFWDTPRALVDPSSVSRHRRQQKRAWLAFDGFPHGDRRGHASLGLVPFFVGP
jgi:hypothetical protein